MSRTIGTWAAIAAALILLAAPFHMVFSGHMPQAIYNALAADTYYYAAIARNFTEHGFFGIDGRTVSNGYMPLWQMVIAGLDVTMGGSGTPPQHLLTLIFFASLALMAVGVCRLTYLVARRYNPHFALLTVPLICPGAAFFLFEHAYHEYIPNGIHSGYSLWSLTNGMESGVGFALFAIFVPLAIRCLDPAQASQRLALWAGALTFLIMMARLDDVFVGIAFGLCLLVLAVRTGQSRLVLYMAIVPLLGTALYLALNSKFAGSALPTSGMLKTQLFGFPNRWVEFSSIGTDQALDGRMLPLTAAIGFGLLGMLSQLRRSLRGPDTPLVVLLSLYLLLKAGFLLSSVPAFEQGYWYYTNMIAAMNLLVVIALAHVLALSRQALAIGIPVTLTIAGIAAANASAHLTRFPPDNYPTVARDLCANPQKVTRLFPPGAKIVDTGDGVYAFCLGRPAHTLTGLADSREFIRQRNTLGFLEAAHANGHEIIVDSPVRWASYHWRNFLVDPLTAQHLGTVGSVNVWRISPK